MGPERCQKCGREQKILFTGFYCDCDEMKLPDISDVLDNIFPAPCIISTDDFDI